MSSNLYDAFLLAQGNVYNINIVLQLYSSELLFIIYLFIQMIGIPNEQSQLRVLTGLVQSLPLAHSHTLYVLLQFLSKIAMSANVSPHDQSIGNRMDSHNLATIFAPNILRTDDPKRISSNDDATIEQKNAINAVK